MTSSSPVLLGASSSVSSAGSHTPPSPIHHCCRHNTRRNPPVSRRRASSLPIAVPPSKSPQGVESFQNRRHEEQQTASCMYFEAKTRSMASKLVNAGISCEACLAKEEEDAPPPGHMPLSRRVSSAENLGVFALED